MFLHYCCSQKFRYLLSGSSNGQAFIWHVDKPDLPPIVLDGHHKEVTAVCWSPSLTEVRVCMIYIYIYVTCTCIHRVSHQPTAIIDACFWITKLALRAVWHLTVLLHHATHYYPVKNPVKIIPSEDGIQNLLLHIIRRPYSIGTSMLSSHHERKFRQSMFVAVLKVILYASRPCNIYSQGSGAQELARAVDI